MTIEERVKRLEDIDSIHQLKSNYCNACDAGHDPDKILDLFTPDGVWEVSGRRHSGHAEMRQVFEGLRETISFSQHNTTNLQLVVDGSHAAGVWHFLGVVELRDGPARMTLARYDEEYVETDDGWKIHQLRAIVLARVELPDLAVIKATEAVARGILPEGLRPGLVPRGQEP